MATDVPGEKAAISIICDWYNTRLGKVPYADERKLARWPSLFDFRDREVIAQLRAGM